MRSPRHPGVLAGAAILALFLAGCGLIDQVTDPGPPPEDAGAKARERVQIYLDAMKAKDITTGRGQLCPVIRPTFDQAAKGPNGDFADHFTVAETAITEVRAKDGRQQVSTSVTVTASGRSAPVNLLFTVTKVDGQWCIAGEAPDGKASPSPAPVDEDPTPRPSPTS